ncbi:hypothetical protein KY385_01175 [Candidatus Parcubacteria bacterium]|nr:hypothetical protein [Candidatus Parcubacteria bacterium]
MINLLPSDYKTNIIYARRNWLFRKWIFTLIIALFGSLAIIAGGYIFMDQSIKDQTRGMEAARADLEADNIEGTRKELSEISTNTKLILQVLSKEVLFSKLIRQLGASLPANTALEEVKIDDLDGSVNLRAVATSVDSATQIQVNLNDPGNKIFEKADIENITCEKGEESSPYPCIVQLKALFSKNNPYTYVPATTGTEKSP